jgi:nucleoside-diphosphate-sugar epimerase
VKDVDTVYHLAGHVDASTRKTLYRVNIEGTRNIAAACADRADPPVLVIVSTIEAGGPVLAGRARTETDPPQPITHYGRSKLMGERAAGEFAARVPMTILRTPAVFGESDHQTLNVFKAFRLGGLGIYPLPRAHRIKMSLLHARDLAEFMILAAGRGERLPPDQSAPPGLGVYYPAYEEQPTFAEVIEIAAHAVDQSRIWILDVPLAFAWLVAGMSELWSRLGGRSAGVINFDKVRVAAAAGWTCSPEKSIQLGFAPAHSLADRLRQTARWYLAEGWL